MWAPTSTQALSARRRQFSRPGRSRSPRVWLAKSTTVVVPPKAAALVPVPKVSTVRAAPIFEAAVDPIGPEQLFIGDPADPSGARQDAWRWLGVAPGTPPPETAAGQVSPHDRDVYAFSVTVDRALDWTAFGIWLTMLLNAHGDDILRVKGILHVVGVPTPVVVHGVQHLVHPPVHLDGWPTEDRGTRLVFIVRKLPRQVIERSLAAFNRLATVGERVA